MQSLGCHCFCCTCRILATLWPNRSNGSMRKCACAAFVRAWQNDAKHAQDGKFEHWNDKSTANTIMIMFVYVRLFFFLFFWFLRFSKAITWQWYNFHWNCAICAKSNFFSQEDFDSCENSITETSSSSTHKSGGGEEIPGKPEPSDITSTSSSESSHDNELNRVSVPISVCLTIMIR